MVAFMVFNSFSYLLFFPIVSIIYFLLPGKARNLWLLISSYFFYFCADIRYVYLLLAITMLSYGSGIVLEKLKTRGNPKFRKGILITTVILNLGILGYFKYANFFLQNLNRVAASLHSGRQFAPVTILLSVGISFIIFQSISYTVDVYRDTIPAEKNLLDFALYPAFFPKLFSGPIERAGDILKQIHAPADFSLKNVKEGLYFILMGLFYKVVLSDNIAAVINPVFASYNDYSGFQIAFAVILFAFQIYGDFGGYSYIAIGSAKILGFQLTNNFESPYHSESISEFWRRWHITLNKWFTDYLYIPLGGSRRGTARRYLNTMIVFLLSGLWHGADWTYIVWGGLNGLFVVGENIKKQLLSGRTPRQIQNADSFGSRLKRRIVTFILVDFAWLFFCMPDMESSFGILHRAAAQPGIRQLFDLTVFNIFPDMKSLIVILSALFLLLWIDTVIYRKKTPFPDFFFTQSSAFRWLFGIGILCMIIFFGAYGDTYEQTQFIYFQF